jgi:NAD(P)-dependent dehydrogenase (short-subunit alcohol dehydrogenase family)
VNYPDELMFLKNRKAQQTFSHASLQGKTIVLTGATSGIGLKTAQALAAGGANLVLVARNPKLALQVQTELITSTGVNVKVIQADFSDLEEVHRAADQILQVTERIDGLINCAGMHSTKLTFTKAGLETVFCVNHLAAFALTCRLLPRLKASAPSRIVHINSEGHRFSAVHLDDLNWKQHHYTGLRGYGASKTAQLLTTWELHDRLTGSGVTINAMHPGDVRSNIGQNNGWMYRLFSKIMIQPMLKDAEISAKSIYTMMADPQRETISGRFYHLTIEEIPAKHATDRSLSPEVFTKSCTLTGIDPITLDRVSTSPENAS